MTPQQLADLRTTAQEAKRCGYAPPHWQDGQLVTTIILGLLDHITHLEKATKGWMDSANGQMDINHQLKVRLTQHERVAEAALLVLQHRPERMDGTDIYYDALAIVMHAAGYKVPT